MTKYIVVAGGVISGVGKGVTTASIGRVLKEHGYSVTAVKIDPYINFDAGTLRPTEHGEVWVTDDGGEIDQDLGNYERFLGEDIPKRNNITTGQVYKAVIDRERAGKYLGKTVQFIPHIPEEIKNRVKAASDHNDFVLIEIGGTIGDFENVPFLFAMKSLERELNGDVIFVLVTYLPVPSHIEEMKTKPTQQAVRMLSENGIFPDLIICRAKKALDDVRKKKIETYANMRSDHVISEPDIDTIYRIPLDLEKDKIGDKILKLFRMRSRKRPKWKEWSKAVDNIVSPKRRVKVAMIGKYVDIGDYNLADSYISINHSLQLAGAEIGAGVDIEWIDSKKLEKDKDYVKKLANYDGVIVPGGFGSSGVEGKIIAIEYARTHDIPYLGLCYGMQLAVVEFARNVCGLEGANTSEVNSSTEHPVIDILPMQKKLIEQSRYGGTMRLGAYAAMLKKGTRILKLYKDTGRLRDDKARIKKLKKDKSQSFRLGVLKGGNTVLERHRHRYEVNPNYVHQIEENGLVFSGYHEREDGQKLMEFIELPKHKYFVGTQGHPEFKGRFGDPAPLFLGFVKACLK